ncbi:uncharacterized protein LAESUDRAFT_720632 [Laetiporus sulphureus 93-53]|uniref:Uncharacterized protein n=1 Tax=Laetiporus sulphureus 93-53 TaxID=1314785 RepID=A0A165H8Y7_9APHY|nr:uncharacterized protein LAESUDRAFT_720632 [Laetiporus sulphureus 93-53]KZT11406.1 hypothetical protein LAESUDRAFT_720632 [Laetiporus sulphureus 93-53]
MNYTQAPDNFVVVAPRPVRLAAPAASSYASFQHAIHRPQTRVANNVRLVADGVDLLKLGEEPFDVHDDFASSTKLAPPDSSDRESLSPRASPRSSLPSEALEEFLSILQSSTLCFPPTSPILRPSNTNLNTPHTFFYARSSSLSPGLSDHGLGLTLSDTAAEDGTAPPYPFKLLGSAPLASPVSRSHTRNPFQRHPSYDTASTTIAGLLRPLSISPSPAYGNCSSTVMALSPATVPLPLPTPDEMETETLS